MSVSSVRCLVPSSQPGPARRRFLRPSLLALPAYEAARSIVARPPTRGANLFAPIDRAAAIISCIRSACTLIRKFAGTLFATSTRDDSRIFGSTGATALAAASSVSACHGHTACHSTCPPPISLFSRPFSAVFTATNLLPIYCGFWYQRTQNAVEKHAGRPTDGGRVIT